MFSILYLISVITLFISFLLYKKNDRSVNFIVSLILNFVYLILYNVLISLIFTIINLSINLFTFSIINIFLSVLLFYRIFKCNEIQKFEYNRREIILFVFIVIFTALICFINFDFSFNIAYETTDPNVHYFSAYSFYMDDNLLSKADVNYPIYGTFDSLMPISYVNIGMLFKTFAPFIGESNLYKIFILYDSFLYILAVLVFYSSIISIFKNKKFVFSGLLIIFFFSIGYPLSNLEFGFRYLGDTVVVINALIILFSEFKEYFNQYSFTEKVKLSSIIALCSLGVFFGYYLFVPFVYSSIFVYLFIFYKGKILKKEYLLINFLILLLPLFIGICYFFTPLFKANAVLLQPKGEAQSIFDSLKLEGYIYRDLYSNLIIFIPFVFSFVYYKIKNRDISFTFVLLIILILFILLLFIMGMFNMASSYYYFKNYFVLWVILFYITSYVIINIISEKSVVFLNSSCITILVMFIMLNLNFDHRVATRNSLYNVDSKMVKYFDIYATNKVLMNHTSKLNSYDLETLEYYIHNVKVKDYNNISVIGDTHQRLWFYCLTRDYPNVAEDGTFSPFYEESYDLVKFIESNNDTLVSFKPLDEDMKTYLNNINVEYSILFENSDSFILKK